jgi:hypothetical protein
MPTRNTVVLTQIIESLGDQIILPTDAMAQLEEHFADKLLIVAGDTNQVLEYARRLRLTISKEEAGLVLDYIASESLAGLSLEHVEDAINALFGNDRFIEPEN